MPLQSPPESSTPLADPLAESSRILDAAEQHGVTLRAAGGVGVATLCPSALKPPLRRFYQDIDFVSRSRDLHAIEKLLVELGYVPAKAFNAIHGQDRMFFDDLTNSREVDIFVERIHGSHELVLKERLDLKPRTLSPADLLLSKLQVYFTNDKDLIDIIVLLCDQPLTEDETGINLAYIADVCSSDWGWWKTVTIVAQRAQIFARDRGLNGYVPGVIDKLQTIVSTLESAPKSRKWKLRARIGERMRWYEVPEEAEH
jgi:hypothetical protein